MKRQLYMGGGIMNIVPRDKAVLGGLKKTLKKAVGGIKDIFSSDVGKLALLGLGGYGLATGSFGLPKLPMPEFATDFLAKEGVKKTLGVGLAGAIFGGAFAGKSEEEVKAITSDKNALKAYLTQYYTNLNPELRINQKK